jgi:thiamine kinase-like enzyme
VHGDPRRGNLGSTRGATSRLVLIDWQFVSAQPPAVDLAWFLYTGKPMETSKEMVIAYYRDQIAIRLGGCFDPIEWEVQLQLALLGQCLRCFGLMLYNAHHGETADVRELFRAELPWWCE